MNRRDLIKAFAAGGIVIGGAAAGATIPKRLAEEITPDRIVKHPDDVIMESSLAYAKEDTFVDMPSQTVETLVANADEILLDLNKMPLIGINMIHDNNVRLNSVIGSLETYPTTGMCEQTVEITCYVEDNIRALFQELKHQKVRVFYRQPIHPQAEVKDTDPVVLDSMAILESMELRADGASFDMEASLVLRLVA